LQKIPKNSIIWLAGDFNMPDIDWSSEAIKNSCKFKTLYEDFLENIVSLNLEQMVKIPTRNNNILDLLLTNVPSLVHNVKSLPSLGNSDHDIIFHEFNINRGRPVQPQRKIPCYKKANWSKIKSELNDFHSKFRECKHTDPNSAWTDFKTEFHRLCDLYIPTKMTKHRQNLPWVTMDILRQIRKRDKMYARLKKKNEPPSQIPTLRP